MIRRITALNYRCLRYVDQELGDFHVLVGANATGKSTFLDVVAFLGDLVSEGLEAATELRTQNFTDLVWQRKERPFELAIELAIPDERRTELKPEKFDLVRYEVRIGVEEPGSAFAIMAERVLLKHESTRAKRKQRSLFPEDVQSPETILSPKSRPHTKTVVNKVPGGKDNFHVETGKRWHHSFMLGPNKSALGNLPDDETQFPAASWLKQFLVRGIHRLVLNSALMRKPSPPGKPAGFLPDGSNLPWVVEQLRQEKPQDFQAWRSHLRTALPDLVDVSTVLRPEDRHRYLVLEYEGATSIPSWGVSDGTLRLMALTLPAYMHTRDVVYLIEEPENGIHPRAIETMFDSLSSVYDAQILMATHSPVVLGLAEASSVLCFAKTAEGATDIVSGNEHPDLTDWQGEVDLGTLFAGGVLS